MIEDLQNRLDSIETTLKNKRDSLIRKEGELLALEQAKQDAQVKVSTLSHDVVVYEKVAALLVNLADSRQSSIVSAVEKLVTHGLRLIFEQELSFIVELDTKARRTTCSFYIESYVHNEVIRTPILSSRGGGVASVAAFLLRVILVILSGTRRLLVLDETFAQLSSNYEEPCAAFIKTLTEKANMQIILVTHSTTYQSYADIVYKTTLKDGWTQFEKLEV